MTSSTKRLLDAEKRLSAAKGREVIRIVVTEILCARNQERHIT